MSGPLSLYLNNVERVDDHGLEWGWSTEEILGGNGAASIIVQDRDNTLEPEEHWDVKIVIKSSGWVLWRGEVTDVALDLDDAFPWRRWKLTLSDYNNEFSQRLVGALDGKTWMDTSGLGIFVNIDPYAATLETDKLTVQAWIAHYIQVGGETIETDTYVSQYIEHLFIQDFDYSDLQAALEKVAAMVAANLQFWLDPDLSFHWTTIPAWQDLAQELVELSENDDVSASAMLFPEADPTGLALSPYSLSDSTGTGIPFSSLKIKWDGARMPEQVYVKGATGYVYNSPPLPPAGETKTTVQSPTPGAADRYELTFLTTTKLWHTDSTGYVSVSYDTCGASGPYEVKWVQVAWNATRNKGGHYWQLLTGPNAGKLVDNDTNVLSGYGSIVVQKIVLQSPPSPDPIVGVGGSGWTNEVTQDPTKRQVYLDAQISTTVAERDSVGGQALYRGQFAALRGSVKVRGYDGWRAGQLVRIQDARLPTGLNGRYFIIQRVHATPIPGQDYREYDLDFGDGPESRYTAERAQGEVSWPTPFIQIDVQAFDLTPGSNSSQRIVGQLISASGEPWKIAGKTVNWVVECYNAAGVKQMNTGSVTPEVSISDKNGRAYTTLTTGSGTNLVYYIFADVKAT